MADPTQNVSGSNPASQEGGTGSLKINLTTNAMDVFNPNAALAAVQTYMGMNSVANQLFGIEARWFRAVPQQRSKDIIFKEYTLSCVEEEPICLRVVVPDGNFPDSKYQYDLMGLEYEVPTEIQIDKKYWEQMAGFGTAPQKKDIVYLTMPNKLYQVESSYLKRAFLEQETTWVVNLRKYMPEASRREGDALKETIDKYTVSEQEIFGEHQEYEYIKNRDDRQMSPFNSTERDKYKSIDANLEILPNNIEFYGTIFAQGFYDMSTPKLYSAVEYKNPSGDEIKESYDRAITAWIMPQDVKEEYEVTWIEPDSTITIPANYKIKIKGTKRFQIDDVFTIYRSEALNFYAKVIDDNHAATGIYWCQIDQPVVNYLNSVRANWNTMTGYKMKLKYPIVLLDGRNETNTGFTVSIGANQFVKIKYASQEYIAVMPEKLNDNQWYGVVVNIGNTWNQYNVYVWEQNPNTGGEKIRIKFYETMKFNPEYTKVDRYTLDKCPAYITNIRLFKTTIEEEKQPKELLSYFTKDSDQALILDNADHHFRAPYISKQR
jgi:hypothetical protein